MALGFKKRSDAEEIKLRVKMLQSTHLLDVYQKCRDELGDRAKSIGPLDITRNPVMRTAAALSTAYTIAPGVTGLTAEMAKLIGDSTSIRAIQRYRAIGYAPMPTTMRRVSAAGERYLVICHYFGVEIGFSRRFKKPTLNLVTPDELSAEFDADSPDRPIVVRRICKRKVQGRDQIVTDTYDLRDLDAPTYRVMQGDRDVTQECLGDTFDGPAYPWRYSDGTPFCPVILVGSMREITRGLEIVEGTLRLSVGWSWFWAGFRDSAFKGRNTYNMRPRGMESRTDDEGGGAGTQGLAVGPEDVVMWDVDDPEKQGEHWQWDSPFDAKAAAETLDRYETQLLTQLGYPVALTQTGGEPLAYELAARQTAAMGHYDALRAGDVEILRAVAAICNRELDTTFSDADSQYGVDYNEEFAEDFKNGRGSETPGIKPVVETGNPPDGAGKTGV